MMITIETAKQKIADIRAAIMEAINIEDNLFSMIAPIYVIIQVFEMQNEILMMTYQLESGYDSKERLLQLLEEISGFVFKYDKLIGSLPPDPLLLSPFKRASGMIAVIAEEAKRRCIRLN